MSSTGTLSVLVEDVNDNAPSFPQSRYSLEVEENREDNIAPILHLGAVDRDLGTNSLIR